LIAAICQGRFGEAPLPDAVYRDSLVKGSAGAMRWSRPCDLAADLFELLAHQLVLLLEARHLLLLLGVLPLPRAPVAGLAPRAPLLLRQRSQDAGGEGSLPSLCPGRFRRKVPYYIQSLIQLCTQLSR
jgi:hypothetical protein